MADVVTEVFTANGTFTPPVGVTEYDALIVGGGGAGGGHYGGGGGGGAGGVRIITGIPVAGAQAVVVGAGGPAPVSTLATGADGSPSSIAGYTALGGGGGGAWEGNPGGNAGRPGGSGGGGGGGGTGTGGAGTAGQGFKGGNGLETGLGHLNAGAGGGGAGAAGANAITNNTATAGGIGVDVSALFGAVGVAGWVGGGGGGAAATNSGGNGAGGQGGGGRGYGGAGNPVAGTANTGGGGGGGEHDGGILAKAGGSGLVVVRYDVPDPPDPPTSLTQTAATETTVDVDWVAPVAGGAPTSYEVRVDGGTPVDVGLVLTVHITGLTASTTYDVEVRAVNSDGFSSWVSVDATTADPNPPEPPTDLIQTAATPTAVGISWVAPATGSTPTSYEVRVDGGTPVDVGDVLIHTIVGLSPETTYTVEVRSVSPDGVSSWVSVEVTTAEAPPPPPPPRSSCFALVRGSVLRVTGLDRRGGVPDVVPFATSKSVIKVTVNEVVEAGSNEIIKNPEEDRRLRLIRSAQTIRYTVDVEFLRVDPSIVGLVSGAPVVLDALGNAVGFDSGSRLPPTPFALEVWSKLAGSQCVEGVQVWGYTLFPYLKGGRLSGFKFANGLVSFNLVGAQTRRGSRWGVGPHDLKDPFERLVTPVSRNTSYRTISTTGVPPEALCGLQTRTDILDNGTASNPMPDPTAPLIVDGGGAETSAYIIYGGRA